MKIYVIKDKVAKQFSSPLAYNNDECAIRHFKQLMNSQPNLTGSDYELFKLLDFDEDTGEVSNVSLSVVLNGGNEYEKEK